MPAKLSKNQFLDAKRVIKESKSRLSNKEIVKRAKLGSEKVVPIIRKARSYQHYCELVREKNRAAKARREAAKGGTQASLLPIDEKPAFKKPKKAIVQETLTHTDLNGDTTEVRQTVERDIPAGKGSETELLSPLFDDSNAEIDVVTEIETVNRIARDNWEAVPPLTMEEKVEDLWRRMPTVQRSLLRVAKQQAQDRKDLDKVADDILFTVPEKPKKNFIQRLLNR